jgi:hypothetical protein
VTTPDPRDPSPRGSLRWWFEDRRTGRITVAQAPNWPIYALGVTWLARRFTSGGSGPDDLLAAAWTALWIYWGADELIRGVNPWRRVLGATVIAWQVWSRVR